MESLLFTKLDHRAKTPVQGREGDNAYDLHALESVTLQPGERTLVKTGIAIALPEGVAGLVIPRSGLALKHGISVVNSPGLVDSNYRGDVGVVLWNTDQQHSFSAAAGDRIAQLLLISSWTVKWQEQTDLPATVRGDQGYGSSGQN